MDAVGAPYFKQIGVVTVISIRVSEYDAIGRNAIAIVQAVADLGIFEFSAVVFPLKKGGWRYILKNGIYLAHAHRIPLFENDVFPPYTICRRKCQRVAVQHKCIHDVFSGGTWDSRLGRIM